MMLLALAIPWFGGIMVALLDGRKRRTGLVAIAVLAASFIASIVNGIAIYRHGAQEMVAGGWEAGVGITLRLDTLGVAFTVLSLGVLLAALAFEVANGVQTRVFPALVLLMATGLTGLFLTGDAFNFYVFFEISMIAAYVMTSYGGQPRQLRASFIFAVVNLIGSVLFVIGIAAVYHITGRLDMAGIRDQMPLVSTSPAILTATIIFVAFSIKLGLFPFHFWLPPVYTGTTPAVAAILSGALANIGTYGILRFGGDLFPRELARGGNVLLILGSLSIVYGALQAISRGSAGEVLAYSAIGQVGYILIAIGIGGRAGFVAAILYAIINSLNKTALFFAMNLRGWIVSAAFAIGAFSVAGVPPALGFFAKLALFRLGANERDWWVIALVFIGGAMSFIYMFQLYGWRFLKPADGDETPTPLVAQLITGAVALALVALGVWPEPLLALSQHAASVLPGVAP